MVSETFSTAKAVDGDGELSPSLAAMKKREKQQGVWLIAFASVSTFLYAGAVYGWGPMQLLLEANGNFASRCEEEDQYVADNSTVVADDETLVCPDQTAAFLNVKFVSHMTLLSGTVWGILSDRYGKKVLTHGFGLCNIMGIILLIIGVRFPSSMVDGFSLYGSFFLMGLGSTVGGMLTVETGLLFKSDQKQQNRIISLLNALFDAGAMAYLGIWGLEKVVSSPSSSSSNSSADISRPNASFMLILIGYLLLAVVSIGGYTFLFQKIQRRNHERESGDGDSNTADRSNTIDEEANREDLKPIRYTLLFNKLLWRNEDRDNTMGLEDDTSDEEANRDATATISLPSMDDGDRSAPMNIDAVGGEETPSRHAKSTKDFENVFQPPPEESAPPESAPPSHPKTNKPYTPIAMRSPGEQLTSKAYILLGIWFSFHCTSNHWTLTTARDFLGSLGDDAYGNRYLTIFTLLTPFSVVALPFLDRVVNKFGFHAALQAVNVLAIVHGIIKLWIVNLNAQIFGFVVFTFFRCFLYSVGLSCVACFIGPTVIGTASGTLYVLSGVASFINIGLAHLAMEEGSFFIPNLFFLVGTLPMIYMTYEMGKALEKDQASKNG